VGWRDIRSMIGYAHDVPEYPRELVVRPVGRGSGDLWQSAREAHNCRFPSQLSSSGDCINLLRLSGRLLLVSDWKQFAETEISATQGHHRSSATLSIGGKRA
jgi:hypothetical protein